MIKIQYREDRHSSILAHSNGSRVYNNTTVHDLSRNWSGCILFMDSELFIVDGVYEYYTEKVTRHPVFLLQSMVPTQDSPSRYLVSVGHPILSMYMPRYGWFNIPGNHPRCVHISRRVSRQFKTGVTLKNTSMGVPFADLFYRARMNNLMQSVSIARYLGYSPDNLPRTVSREGWIFHSAVKHHLTAGKREFPSFRQALKELRTGTTLSVALSPEVALALHPLNGEVGVLYDTQQAGAIDGERLILKDNFFWVRDTIEEVLYGNA